MTLFLMWNMNEDIFSVCVNYFHTMAVKDNLNNLGNLNIHPDIFHSTEESQVWTNIRISTVNDIVFIFG